MSVPLWLLVATCGAAGQLLKFAAYSTADRRPHAEVLFQGYGLPSLQAAALGCLVATVVMRQGWLSSEASFAFVFAVIVLHDVLKLRSAFTAQREAVHRLLTTWEGGAPWRQQVADYLDPLSHHPAHVALGVVFGVLFALAFGLASS